MVNDSCEGLSLVAHMFHLLEFDHFPVAISTSYPSPRATLDKVALTVRLSQNFQRVDFVLVLLVLQSCEPYPSESAYMMKNHKQSDATRVREIWVGPRANRFQES